MNKLLALLLLLLSFSEVNAQRSTNRYNKTLADSLGADDYGMKLYTLVILKEGSTKVEDSAQRAVLFNGHMQNIKRLADSGKLIVAGPLEENEKKYEGIFILNVKTPAEAEPLLATDPAIKAKLLDVELYQWYGSAALPLYLPYHEAVQKKSF